jgi:hypothetical protein
MCSALTPRDLVGATLIGQLLIDVNVLPRKKGRKKKSRPDL